MVTSAMPHQLSHQHLLAAFLQRRSFDINLSLTKACSEGMICSSNGYEYSEASYAYGSIRGQGRLQSPGATAGYATLQKASPSLPVAKLFEDTNIRVNWHDGQCLTFNNVFLRDNCHCPDCQYPETKQRKLDAAAIPLDIKPADIAPGEKGLSITWANDGHESFYSWNWLRARINLSPTRMFHLSRLMSFFDPRKDTSPPTVSYADVMSSQDGLKVWIELICRYGFCFVEGCPIDPVATEELLKRISYIRHTHYGGFYDFTSDLALKDTAYTEVALEPHTDTTYFTDPAGLQMFHLLSHTGGGGGYSILLDGFRAARRLLEYSPEDFRVLCNFEVPYHASGNEGISITPSIGSSPVLRGRLDFNFKDDSALTSILPYQIRWNDSDRGDMPIYPSPLPWYRAAKLWRDILKDPDLEYRFQLQPGTALIFDNWRMLHGRSEFTGARRMCGGYINMDDFQSQWKILSLGSREILERI